MENSQKRQIHFRDQSVRSQRVQTGLGLGSLGEQGVKELGWKVSFLKSYLKKSRNLGVKMPSGTGEKQAHDNQLKE